MFRHDPALLRAFPSLRAGLVLVHGVDALTAVALEPEAFEAMALERLGDGTESDLAAIKAWRSTFQQMGLKPTQYRSASEALLRRLRKEGRLPRLHPLVDLSNAVSAAFAIPIAVFDVDRLEGTLTVRHATGSETYLTFAGEVETPAPGEVIFACEAGRAHARRWCNRQSAYSAVSAATRSALLVAEALHPSAAADIERLTETLADRLGGAGAEVTRLPWPQDPTS